MNITQFDGRPRTVTFTASGESVTQIGRSFVIRGCSFASPKREYRHSNPSAYYRSRRPQKKRSLWIYRK